MFQDTILCSLLNFLTEWDDAVNPGRFIFSCALRVHRIISISWIITPFSRFPWNFSNVHDEISFSFFTLLPSLFICSFYFLRNWSNDFTFRNLSFMILSDLGFIISLDFQNFTTLLLQRWIKYKSEFFLYVSWGEQRRARFLKVVTSKSRRFL